MSSDELACLRTEVAAAWEEVKRTGDAHRTHPNAQTRLEAHAALSCWSKLLDALHEALRDRMRFEPSGSASSPGDGSAFRVPGRHRTARAPLRGAR